MAYIEIEILDYIHEISTKKLQEELARRKDIEASITHGGGIYSKADLLAAIDAGDRTHLLIVIDNLDLSL